MSLQVHHPGSVAHHPALLAAAIAALIAGGATAGIAWEASRPAAPAPAHPAMYHPQVHRMVHGFNVTLHR
jgi:hypothetical protein